MSQSENPFQTKKYETLERFISYYYQIELIRELNPKTLLEIGVGSKVVSEYLKRMGIQVTTCDIDPNLFPDKVGDIRNLPFGDESFDVLTVFQVLEHLPFSDFEKALKEINRVSKRYAIISLPHQHICLEIVFKIPFIGKIFKKTFFDFNLRIPRLFFYNKKWLGQHLWEIGLKHYSLKTIRQYLQKYFRILKEKRPLLNPYHHFFVLEKLKENL